MNFSSTFHSKLLYKGISGILSGLMLTSTPLLEAYSLPAPMGPPIVISPGPSVPDPILQNLEAVMDDHYQLPYYPGLTPYPSNYLGGIYYMSNNYIGAGIVINPCDENIVHFSIGQNQILDGTGTFYFVTVGTNTFLTSRDKGLTWSYGPPIEQIIPLGGTISQIVNASLGPGLYYEYNKTGRLNASGWGFFNMRANPPGTWPYSGFLFTHSDDAGEHWAPTDIILTNGNNNEWFNTSPYTGNQDPLYREFYTTNDPVDSDIVYGSTSALFRNVPILRPKLAPGETLVVPATISYLVSQNGGKTFSPPRNVYSMMDDPLWRAEHFDPNYNRDPAYAIYGGTAYNAGHPLVLNENTLLLPVRRLYPLVGSRSSDTFIDVCDQGVLRSTDRGRTWSQIIYPTDQYQVTPCVFDPGFPTSETGIIINGFLCFPRWDDSGFQEQRNSASHAIVSATTGRIYLTYGAAFPNSLRDLASQNLLMSSSDDQGFTWTSAVQVNKTPTDIPLRIQQAFAHNAVMSSDGWYVVAYYDFRYWTGFPGEIYDNIPLDEIPPLPTDAWLAVYRETEDPRGGSTGAGLDFVEEIRLTPQSFNARINNIETAIPYNVFYITGTPEGLPLAFSKNNELYAVYSMQKSGSPSNINTSGYKGMTVDTNGYQTLFLQRFKFPKPSNQ